MGAVLSSLVAPVGVVAVITFLLSLTRTSRLKKEEGLLRDNLSSLSQDSQQRKVVADLHRAALGQLIARQMTPRWQLVWPIVLWFFILVINGSIGFYGTRYIISAPRPGFWELSVQATGDPAGLILPLFLLVGIYPTAYFSFVHTLTMRAKIARRFYDGLPIYGWSSYLREVVDRDYKKRTQQETLRQARTKSNLRTQADKNVWRAFIYYIWHGIPPGIFLAGLGIMAGSTIAIRFLGGAERESALSTTALYVSVTILITVISLMRSVSSMVHMRRKMSEYSLPVTYPDGLYGPSERH